MNVNNPIIISKLNNLSSLDIVKYDTKYPTPFISIIIENIITNTSKDFKGYVTKNIDIITISADIKIE